VGDKAEGVVLKKKASTEKVKGELRKGELGKGELKELKEIGELGELKGELGGVIDGKRERFRRLP
tara:strand:- start:1357 stop:1551 length:195 start_codon:yes stop_codon:yes gene_type:complete